MCGLSWAGVGTCLMALHIIYVGDHSAKFSANCCASQAHRCVSDVVSYFVRVEVVARSSVSA